MKRIIFIACLLSVLSACSILQTFSNISRLKFKIESVDDFLVNGIAVEGKSKLSDFDSFDVIKLSSVVSSGKLPVSFNLNISVINPNDGSGGFPASGITLKSFPWELYINDNKTISGNIAKPIFVPGVGIDEIIKLKIEMDLLEFFENQGLKEVMNLALKFGGRQGSTSNIKVIASPVLDTSIGDIKYPEPITIVDYTYN